MIFQDATPLSFELQEWRANLMTCIILPLLLWNQIKYDGKSLYLYRNVMIVCISIATIYGFMLTFIPGTNPYISLLAIDNGSEFLSDYAAVDNVRIFGRISSVFGNPQSFGLFLGFSFVYMYICGKRYNAFFSTLIILLILVDVFVCGVRSVIGGVGIVVIYYFLHTRNYRIAIFACVVMVIGNQIVLLLPALSDYLGSIVDIDNGSTGIAGSSIDMRLNQLIGCIKEIKQSYLFGKGYSWTTYYLSIRGNHPVILAFESLIFVILCNSGYIGFIIWGIFIWLIVNYNKKKGKEHAPILNSFLIFYISYSCITGEYGYMGKFSVFYILALAEVSYTSFREPAKLKSF